MTPYDDSAARGGGRPAPGAPWDRAAAAVTLLLVDPAGLGGLWLRARAGPLRDRVTAALAALPSRRLHPGIGDSALFGGLDLAATLAAGRPVEGSGLLDGASALTLAMAERCPPGLSGRLARALDTGAATCLIAQDEGAGPEEALPSALADRLALFVDLDGIAWGDSAPIVAAPAVLAAARARLGALRPSPEALEQLVRAAAALGIASLRAPTLALACARAAAAWRGADSIETTDLQQAAELVLAHRALPVAEAAPAPEPPPPQAEGADSDATGATREPLPEEILVAAARAALPEDILARLSAGRQMRALRGGSSGSGAARRGCVHGRPLPARPGRPQSGARVDLVATLRTAAPWQGLRRHAMPTPVPGRSRLILLPSDIRLRRFEERSDRVLIFVVDASGSAAVARLAEAKGAVELMLARAYARRDHVALVAFRGQGAELVLPPTRSLVQAKRRLAGLPGGGGTPLAAGLRSARDCAALARARGMTPTIALLTDGRGNIALDGTPGRPRAAADAQTLARVIAAEGIAAVVIDTAMRPQPALAALAAQMGARCVAMPRADAAGLSAALVASLSGGAGPR